MNSIVQFVGRKKLMKLFHFFLCNCKDSNAIHVEREPTENITNIYPVFIPCNFRMMEPLSSLLFQLPGPHKNIFDTSP